MTTTTEPLACDCTVAADGIIFCDECGNHIAPACSATRIITGHGTEDRYGERGYQVCRDCAGPAFLGHLDVITNTIDTKREAERQAREAATAARQKARTERLQKLIGATGDQADPDRVKQLMTELKDARDNAETDYQILWQFGVNAGFIPDPWASTAP